MNAPMYVVAAPLVAAAFVLVGAASRRRQLVGRRVSWGLTAAAILAFVPLAIPQKAPAAFPGGNGKIAYESNINAPANDSSLYDIYVMNPDGSGQTRLTTEGGAGPAWSPDGTKIVFDTRRDGNSEIYVMNADGTDQTRLTDRGATDIFPSWSPDGSQIVFASYDCCGPGSNYDIWVMNADGTDLVNLTNNPAEDIFPVWQPGGAKIAFQTDRDGNTEIYAMNPDGSGLVNLTNDAAGDGTPDWSPDGSKIAFNSNRAAPYTTDIYVMNADGSGLTRLTSTTHDFSAAWSPDGSKIVFTSNRDFNDEIYVMNADGSNATRLTNDPLTGTVPEDWFPDWQQIRTLATPAPWSIPPAPITPGGDSLSTTAPWTIPPPPPVTPPASEWVSPPQADHASAPRPARPDQTSPHPREQLEIVEHVERTQGTAHLAHRHLGAPKVALLDRAAEASVCRAL